MISHLLNVVYSSVGFKDATPEVALELLLLAEKCKPYASTLDLIEPTQGRTIRANELQPELLQKLTDLNLLSFNIWDKTTNSDVIFSTYGKAVKSLLAADLEYDKIYKTCSKAPTSSVCVSAALDSTTDVVALQRALYETTEFTNVKLQAVYILNHLGSGHLLPIGDACDNANLLHTLNNYSALGLISVMPAGQTFRAKTTVKGDELLQSLLKEMEQTK